MKITIDKCIPIPAIRRPGRVKSTTIYPLASMVAGDSIRLKIGTKETIDNKILKKKYYQNLYLLRRRLKISGTWRIDVRPVDNRFELRYWKVTD